MKLNNYQIFEYAQNLFEIFDKDDLYIPVRANFLIQKNIKLIAAAGEEIEKARLQIAVHYGKLDAENNQYIISPEHIEKANEEIMSLFAIEQELDIKMVNLTDLENTQLTAKQMQALMFMIED